MINKLRFEKKWVVLILSILITLATFSVHAQQGSFTETFDDPTLPGWEHSPNADVVDGVLRIDLSGYALHSGEWGDLNLRVRANLVGEGAVVVSYRVGEAGEYAIHISGDEITLYKSGEPIAHETIEPVPPREWIFMEVFALGEHHEILLNGQLALVTFDPDPLPPGGVALAIQGEAMGEFDDLFVVSLDKEQPEEENEQAETVSPEEPAPTQETSEDPSSTDLTWVRTGGPPGGIGYDIRYKFDDPNTWYVTDNFAGVHISTDNGLTWMPSNTGIPRQYGPSSDWRPIFSLTVDPHDSDIIWVGTDKTGHIYKSIDGGRTWTQKDSGVSQTTSEYEMLTFGVSLLIQTPPMSFTRWVR